MLAYDSNGNQVTRVASSGPFRTGPAQFDRTLSYYTQGPVAVGGAPGTLVQLLDLGALDFSLFPGLGVPPAPLITLDYLFTAQVLELGAGASSGTLEVHADVAGADQIRGSVTNNVATNAAISMAWSRYGFSSADALAWFNGSQVVLYARAGAEPCNYYEIGVRLRMHFGT